MFINFTESVHKLIHMVHKSLDVNENSNIYICKPIEISLVS